MKLAVFLCGLVVLTEARPQAPQQEVVPDIVAAFDAYHTLWLAEATRNTKPTLSAHKKSTQVQPIAQTSAQEQLTAQQPAQEQLTAQQPAQEQRTVQQPTQELVKAQQPVQVQLAVQQPTQVQLTAQQPTQVQLAAQQPTQVQLAAQQPTQVQPVAEVRKAPQEAVMQEAVAKAALPAPDMQAAFRDFYTLWKAEAARNSIAPKTTHRIQVQPTTQVQQAVPTQVQQAVPTKVVPTQVQQVVPSQQQEMKKVILKAAPAAPVLSAAEMEAEFAKFLNVWQLEAARNARVPTAVVPTRHSLNLLPQAQLPTAFSAPGGKHPVLVGTPVAPRAHHGGPVVVRFGSPQQQVLV